jgi:hypothetical protein
MSIPFHPVARVLAQVLRPAPQVDTSAAAQLLPLLRKRDQAQGVLITVNHYSAPGFHAWWIAILISAQIPTQINWVVTSGWTNSGWLTGITHLLFPVNAKLFGFTPMPAMPPDPTQIEQRARAVRAVLKYAKGTRQPVIGLAPEGGDMPGGVLGSLPPAVGRFIHLLNRECPLILPVGMWTEGRRICMKFGHPYTLQLPDRMPVHERDQQVGFIIMENIAALLPERLRGNYNKKNPEAG